MQTKKGNKKIKLFGTAARIALLASLALVTSHVIAVVDSGGGGGEGCWAQTDADGNITTVCSSIKNPADGIGYPPAGGITPVAEQQRQARCTKNAADQAIFKCSFRMGVPPAFPGGITVPSSFYTAGAWRSSLWDFMNTVYVSDNQYILQSWNTALASALQKCSGDLGCNAEVWLYFGQTNVGLPPIPILGDINWFVSVIAANISTPSFDSSPAKSLFAPVVNGQMCSALVSAAQADGC